MYAFVVTRIDRTGVVFKGICHQSARIRILNTTTIVAARAIVSLTPFPLKNCVSQRIVVTATTVAFERRFQRTSSRCCDQNQNRYA
jgi:hypothetical protein